MDKDTEVELKFPLKNPEELMAELDKIAKPLKRNDVQKDTYYVPAHRNFLEAKYIFEWLRIRDSDKGTHVNYKHFYPENIQNTDYCDEFETEIESPEQMKNSLQVLILNQYVLLRKPEQCGSIKELKFALILSSNLEILLN